MNPHHTSARLRALVFSAVLGATGFLGTSAANAEDILRSLTAFPDSDTTVGLYKRFVDLVNERGVGVVKIEIAGGPEAIPGLQQVEAIGRGVIDMSYTPLTYSLGVMPEAAAWVASDIDPKEQRANGGFALIQDIAKEKLNVHVLARLAPAAPFNIWLLNEPKFKESGELDLTGYRLRVRRRMIWNSLADFGAVGAGSSGSGYAA